MKILSKTLIASIITVIFIPAHTYGQQRVSITYGRQQLSSFLARWKTVPSPFHSPSTSSSYTPTHSSTPAWSKSTSSKPISSESTSKTPVVWDIVKMDRVQYAPAPSAPAPSAPVSSSSWTFLPEQKQPGHGGATRKCDGDGNCRPNVSSPSPKKETPSYYTTKPVFSSVPSNSDFSFLSSPVSPTSSPKNPASFNTSKANNKPSKIGNGSNPLKPAYDYGEYGGLSPFKVHNQKQIFTPGMLGNKRKIKIKDRPFSPSR